MPGMRYTPDDASNEPEYPPYPDYPNYPDYPDYPDYGQTSGSAASARPGGTSTQSVSPTKAEVPPVQAGGSMATAILGVDSLVASDAALLANSQSRAYLGRTPRFWGRYFYAPGQINTAGRRDSHYSAAENAILRANKIRVLPIARQTTHVGRGGQARHDAVQNVAAIFEVFPAQYLSGVDPDVLVFLDVEQENPMAEDYYAAWSATIISEAARISRAYPVNADTH